jgi:glyoxalase-like protein
MPEQYHKEGAMTVSVRPIPEGYHAVTPYLCIQGAARAIEFYKQAFGAREVMRMWTPRASRPSLPARRC